MLPTELSELPLDELMSLAREVRDATTGTRVTYSPKVFIPLTMLCQDRCGYCTFAQPPARLLPPFLEPDEVLPIARAGADPAAVPGASPPPGRRRGSHRSWSPARSLPKRRQSRAR